MIYTENKVGSIYFNANSENAIYGYIVGKDEVTAIKEKRADGEGDKWFYDVFISGKLAVRVFNPNFVKFI